jgi:Kef-type K+ transport system membrane component KefB
MTAISVTGTVIVMRILEELNMINDESATEGKIVKEIVGI